MNGLMAQELEWRHAENVRNSEPPCRDVDVRRRPGAKYRRPPQPRQSRDVEAGASRLAHPPRYQQGTVDFAFKDPNGRTTQVFINLKDNAATHDAEPFVPFARVIEGMDVADALYADYGEKAGGGIRGGKQDPIFAEGNAFFLRGFPKLDYIKRALVVGDNR